MDDIKKYEEAVMRRVCYMVNCHEMDVDTLEESFYFTNQRSIDTWWDENPCDSWILSSFYIIKKIYGDRKRELHEKEKSERELLTSMCELMNQMIDTENHLLSDIYKPFIDAAIEQNIRFYSSYDVAKSKAEELWNLGIENGKIKEQYRDSFETMVNNNNKDGFVINVKKLWSSEEKRYRHATIEDIHYLKKPDKINVSILESGVKVNDFYEYQYLLAIQKILDSVKFYDNNLDSIIESASKSNFAPEQNKNGLPGANWDVLRIVFDKNPQFNNDIYALFAYCANNNEPNIKESWLFQYMNLLPLDLSDDESETQQTLMDLAKNCKLPCFSTAVAFAVCFKYDFLYKFAEKLGGEPKKGDTLAQIMENWGIRKSLFSTKKDENFIKDLITIMQSDGIELDITGMDKFIPTRIFGEKTKKYWIFTAISVVLNAIFAIIAMKKDFSGGAVTEGIFLTWSTLWPAWIVLTATLILTGVFFRKLDLGDDDELELPLIWGGLLVQIVPILICAIAFSGYGFLVGLIRCAIGYVVPVAVGGFIGLMISGIANEN